MLSDLAIRALPTPDKGQRYYWDADGLCVRVSEGGTKTFYLVSGPERKHLKLGRYPVISLAQARKLARTILAEKTLGTYTAPTGKIIADLTTTFLAAYEKKNKPRTHRDMTRMLAYLSPIAKRPVETVATRELLTLIDEASDATSKRRHLFVACSTFFKWAAWNRYIKLSPMAGVEAPSQPTSRDRILSDDELRRIYLAATELAFPFGFIVLVCIHTAMRRSEVAMLKWSYISADYITLPKEITKNSTEHFIPNLIGENLKLVPRTSEYVFPSGAGTPFNAWSKNKAALDRMSGTAAWTLHDLRRTFSTNMARWEIAPPDVVEALLNHKTGSRSPLQRIYDRHDRLPQMRRALEAYEKRLAALIAAH